MKAKSFIEVLEQQIRHDLRDELRKQIEAEVRADLDREARKSETPACDPNANAFERLETWLASHIERRTFASESETKNQARRSYFGSRSNARPSAQDAKSTPRPAEPKPAQSTPPAPQYRAQTVAELCALELLRRYGAKIGDSFTAAELKTAWRKAALQTHPDRFVGADPATQTRMGAIFQEIAHAYEILEALTETPLAA